MQWIPFHKELSIYETVKIFYRHGNGHLVLTKTGSSSVERTNTIFRYENGFFTTIRIDAYSGLFRVSDKFYLCENSSPLSAFCPLTFVRSEQVEITEPIRNETSQGFLLGYGTSTANVYSGTVKKHVIGSFVNCYCVKFVDILIEDDKLTDFVVVTDSLYIPDYSKLPNIATKKIDAFCRAGAFGPEPRTYYGFFNSHKSTRVELIRATDETLTGYSVRLPGYFNLITQAGTSFVAWDKDAAQLWIISPTLTTRALDLSKNCQSSGPVLALDGNAETVDILFKNGVLRVDIE